MLTPTPAAHDWLLLLGLLTAAAAVVISRRHPRLAWPLFTLAAFVALFAGRWPVLAANRTFNTNPDEAQVLAGAITLMHDPVFWRSVDGTSHGPLDQWPFAVLGWLGVPLDYRTARIVAVVLIAAAILLPARAIATRTSPAAALLASLAPLALFACTREPDFLQCTTEYIPLALWSAALWLGWRSPDSAPTLLRAAGVGALLAAAPLAKLQAAPLSAALGALWLVEIFRHRATPAPRLVGATIAGALLVTALCLGPTALAGYGHDIWLCYIVANRSYVADHGWILASFRFVWGFSFFVATVASAFALAACLRARALLRDPQLYVGLVLLASAVAAVLLPGRGYRHYWVLVPSATIWLSAVAYHHLTYTAPGSSPPRPLALASHPAALAALAALFLAPPLAKYFHAPFPRLQETLSEDSTDARAVALIRQHCPPGAPMALWGYRYSLHVDARRRQATREGHSQGMVQDWPLQALWRTRYLDDLRRVRPPVFADSVGPGGYTYHDRPRYAHEVFPELAAYVREHYELAGDVDGVRVYRLKTAPARPSSS